MIAKKFPNYSFFIAGKSDVRIDEETKLTLEKLKECDNIKFVGFLKRSEIREFLGNAIALINTSFYEGFSNTFLESFEVGTPVLATSNVDPDKIIQKNNLGFVSENHEHLDRIVNKIINFESYDLISKKCREYVLNNHESKNL